MINNQGPGAMKEVVEIQDTDFNIFKEYSPL